MKFSVISFILVSAMTSPGVELGQLAGQWSLAEFTSPTSLRESYYNPETMVTRILEDSSGVAGENEILVDAFYPQPSATGTRIFEISNSGAVTGEEVGQAVSLRNNRLLYTAGGEGQTLFANPAGNLLLTSKGEPDLQSLTLCMKVPEAFAISELAGAWHLITMITPNDLSTTGNLSDVYFSGESSLASGEINVAANGQFSGPFSGTLTPAGTGKVLVTTEAGSLEFRVSEGKDVLTATPGGEADEEFIILVKKPAALETADLRGSWRIAQFRVPSTLTEVFWNPDTGQSRQAESSGVAQAGEVLVDLFHADDFRLQQGQIEVTSSGAFTGLASGTLTANADQSITITVPDSPALTFYGNLDHSLMVGSINESDSHELIFLLKTASDPYETFDEAVDLGTLLTPGNLVFTWSGGNGLVLEESDGLGTWSAVEGTEGDNDYAVPTTGKVRFFRISGP